MPTDQPPAEVRIYPTHDCCYVLRRFIVTADDGKTYPSLVSIPQRLFVKPEGEVYVGAKRAEYDQPAQGNPANAIMMPDGRKIQQQSWQPMVGIWRDFPIRKENEQMQPTPELAAEADKTLRPASE